jgi:zinc and cadmium transporter
METLMWIIGSTFLVSLISFIGIVSFAIKEKLLNKLLLALIALSAGALMGGAFIHLIPEATPELGISSVCLYVLAGFVFFFVVEKLLHWRHCHDKKCKVHTFAYMNLIGDAVHNFIDGLVIAASFVTNVPLGIFTTVAIAAHEIPQEIGDFGVLVYGGFSRRRALLLNFLTALTALAGGVAGYFISSQIEYFAPVLLAIAAGGFLYISSSDLIPEMRKVADLKTSLVTMLSFLLGIGIMIGVKAVFGGA